MEGWEDHLGDHRSVGRVHWVVGCVKGHLMPITYSSKICRYPFPFLSFPFSLPSAVCLAVYLPSYLSVQGFGFISERESKRLSD